MIKHGGFIMYVFLICQIIELPFINSSLFNNSLLSHVDMPMPSSTIDKIDLINPAMKQQQKDAYVRLRLQVENGKISITHIKKVAGPLLETKAIQLGDGILYELRKDNLRLDLRAVPYDGLFYGFDTVSETKRKEGEAPESFQLHVRIPLQDMRLKDLKKIEINIYDIQDPFSESKVLSEDIALQFPSKLKKIAALKGIDICRLDGDLSKELKKLF